MPPYTVIRSARRSVAIEIRRDGSVVVRAPHAMPDDAIRRFIESRAAWLTARLTELEARRDASVAVLPFTRDELARLTEEAADRLPSRAAYFAEKMGVTYRRITIRHQRTRWGSCSSAGNLNFNCLLMLLPAEVRDYVIIHELCHLREMNHSPRFWAEVAAICPEYARHRAWLREHGPALIARLDAPDPTQI